MKQETGGHPDAMGNLGSIFRSLNRPEAAGFPTALLDSTFPVPKYTPTGLYVGEGLGFDVSLIRLFRVVERIVRGLYFHETGKRISKRFGVTILSNDSLRKTPRTYLRQLEKSVLIPLANTPAKVISSAFFYRFGITTKPPVSAWGLTFYGAEGFVGLVGPKSAIPAFSCRQFNCVSSRYSELNIPGTQPVPIPPQAG